MLKSITFEVVGDQRLTCEGCEQRVERLLKALQGVRQVRAQARNQRIEVLFDEALLRPTRSRNAWVRPVTRPESAVHLPSRPLDTGWG